MNGDPMFDGIREKVVPGKKIVIDYRIKHVLATKRTKYHILHVLEDDPDQIVCKYWQPHRQSWRYVVEWLYTFLSADRDGIIIWDV